jgi:hypothetical protein
VEQRVSCVDEHVCYRIVQPGTTPTSSTYSYFIILEYSTTYSGVFIRATTLFSFYEVGGSHSMHTP